MMMAKQRYILWGCLILTAATAILYYPILGHQFLNLDDHVYVSQNPYVQKGLGIETILWAFSTFQAEFYHPLTWLSLLADTSLYGNSPSGYLTTNLILHIGNTLLTFLIFFNMTSCVTRSLLVAGLFACHPLHVESVAWISDRKDLLCGFFWLLSIGSYYVYCRRPDLKRYLCLSVFFIFALLAKPMVMTLPCLLLLLDLWPLKRLSFVHGPRAFAKQATRLIREKLPLFAIAIIGGILAIVAQHAGGGLGSLETYPLNVRLENAIVSYYNYVLKIIWPQGLTVFYPFRAQHGYLEVLPAISLFVGMSLLVLWQIRHRPYLAVGWFWFIGTLVPAIGLFRIGDFAMADRYTYVPIIGIFIMVVWGMADLSVRFRIGMVAPAVLVAIVLSGCFVLARQQIRHWSDSESLYRHATAVTDDNYMAHYGLAHVFATQGDFHEAIRHFKRSARIRPGSAMVALALGRALVQIGAYQEAVAVLNDCTDRHPDAREVRFTLGLIHALDRQFETATAEFSIVLEQIASSKNGIAQLHEKEARKLFDGAAEEERRGNTGMALKVYEELAQRLPFFLPARERLSRFYLKRGDYEKALSIYHVKIDPGWLRNAIIWGYDRWADSFDGF